MPYKKSTNNEKGIALIFTLIMLSLLLILAMAFALDSMFEQKAAYNSASVSSAGFLAKSQLNQAILLMKNGQANFDDNRLYSVDSNTPTTTDVDMLNRLQVADVLTATDGVFDSDGNGVADDYKVNWNYAKDGSGNIIGRSAFVIISNEKVPLNSLLNATFAEDTYAETRIGKEISEINIYESIPYITGCFGGSSSRILADRTKIIKSLNYTAQGGKYTGIWISFSQMFTAINSVLTSDLTDTEEDEFEDKLSLSLSKTKETFWADLDGDVERDSIEFYNRFNLTRTDWDKTSSAEDIEFIQKHILLDSDDDNILDADMDDHDDTNTDGTGLPWLACFGYKADGTEDEGLKGNFASVKDRRFQIAANLKDYCDSDIYPTSDIDPRGASATNWINSATNPTYTGNEKTPYINKIGVLVKAQRKQEYTTSPEGRVWVDIEIIPYTELINLYDTTWGEDLIVYIDMDVVLTASANSTTVTIPTQTVQLTIDVGNGTWNSGYSNFAYSYGSVPFSTNKTTIDPINTATMTVNVSSITIKKVVLYRDNSGSGDKDSYDYVKGISFSTVTPVLSGNSDGNIKELLVGWAVHDPRQNLNSGDWMELINNVFDTTASTLNPEEVFSLNNSAGTYIGKPNALNTTWGGGIDTESPDSSTDDLETGIDDPRLVSTARIRNAPMESPWELGFIHRGEKWQTINLKTYDISKAYQVTEIPVSSGNYYILGGGTYALGDANILDQIKMTSGFESLQKISLNTQNGYALLALLSNISYGCGVDASVSLASLATGSPTGTVLSIADINSLASAIETYYANTTNPEQRLTRASAVSQLLLSDSSTPAIVLADITDAVQEELIGKVINLARIKDNGSGDFTIIVLAQTIKDIGDAGISITKVSMDETTTATKTCKSGQFDADTSDSDKNKHVYFDEIVGEQKLLIKGSVSIDGEITIKSYQNID